jgi:hypothetical protein
LAKVQPGKSATKGPFSLGWFGDEHFQVKPDVARAKQLKQLPRKCAKGSKGSVFLDFCAFCQESVSICAHLWFRPFVKIRAIRVRPSTLDVER